MNSTEDARTDSAAKGIQAERKVELRRRLEETRARTLWFLDRVDDADLRRRVHNFYSPIGWHFGHVGRTEEYWAILEAGGEPVDAHLTWLLADLPDNPKDNRIHIPDRAGLLNYLSRTRDVVSKALDAADLSADDPLVKDGYAWDFAIQHECQHQETIAEMLVLLSREKSDAPETLPQPLAWHSEHVARAIDIPGGTFTMGLDAPFVYDNERPAHCRRVSGFRLAETPVTAFEWSQFMEDGGYARRELWSDEGWSWREAEAATMPEYWRVHPEGGYLLVGPWGIRAMDPDEPASSLSWFEADAYARWKGARLPTEVEWEYAASRSQGGDDCLYPWGNAAPSEETAVFGLEPWGPQAIGARTAGSTRDGIRDLAGNVWEWTSSAFLPYDGFRAYPYDGYSKDHMKGAHRVCRGGSWATSPVILRRTFRNWYVPTYRQGFLGLRLAWDA